MSSATESLHQALAALRQAIAAGVRSENVLKAELLVRQAVDTPLPSAKPQGSQRLVVADDEALMRQAMVRALSRGYAVDVYEDGQAAWQAIQDDPPAAVLLDVNMPGLTGLEVVERMRRDPNLAGTPVVLVTARSSERHVAKGMRLGADDYLVKPFRPKELRARLARLLDKSAERQVLSEEQDALRRRSELTAELLHDMGNVLSSVGVSAATLTGSKGTSYARGVTSAGELLDHALAERDDTGAEGLPHYLRTLADAMTTEQQRQQAAAAGLQQRVKALDRLLRRARDHATGEAQEVSVHAAVDEALLLCSGALQGVDVVRDGLDGRVCVQPDQLQQVLVNLMQNAVDAMATVTSRRLYLSATVNDGWVTLSVTDSGIGMSDEVLANMFHRGFSTKGTGRGLGLTSCERVVQDMGGTLRATSEGRGKGACFTLQLPVAAE